MSRVRRMVALLLVLMVLAAITLALVRALVQTNGAQQDFLKLAQDAAITVDVNAFGEIKSVEFCPYWSRNLASEPEVRVSDGMSDFDPMSRLWHWTSVLRRGDAEAETVLVARRNCIERLGDLPHLTSLNLRCEVLSDGQVQPLRRLNRLALLDLGSTDVTDAGLAHLSALRDLRRLSVEGTAMTDAGLQHVVQLANLELLDAGYTKLEDGASAQLASLTNLRWLYLDETQITRLELRGLARLEYLTLARTPLRELQLEGCSSLRVLDLANTRIDDDAMRSVANCDALEELGVARTALTAQALGHLRRLPNLKRLLVDAQVVLESTDIRKTDVLPALEELVIRCDSQHSVGVDFHRDFSAARPRVRIIPKDAW